MTEKLATEPDARLVEFVQRLVRNLRERAIPEKRSELRTPLVSSVRVQAVDQDLQPTDAPFFAVSHDISASGVRLVHAHSERISTGFAALQLKLDGEIVDVFAQELWFRSLGPYGMAGFEFVRLLNGFPIDGGSSESS